MVIQASSEHSVCFAVPEKEVDTVRLALLTRFRRDLDAGRISKVTNVLQHDRMCLRTRTSCCSIYSQQIKVEVKVDKY